MLYFLLQNLNLNPMVYELPSTPSIIYQPMTTVSIMSPSSSPGTQQSIIMSPTTGEKGSSYRSYFQSFIFIFGSPVYLQLYITQLHGLISSTLYIQRSPVIGHISSLLQILKSAVHFKYLCCYLFWFKNCFLIGVQFVYSLLFYYKHYEAKGL